MHQIRGFGIGIAAQTVVRVYRNFTTAVIFNQTRQGTVQSGCLYGSKACYSYCVLVMLLLQKKNHPFVYREYFGVYMFDLSTLGMLLKYSCELLLSGRYNV